MPFSWSTVPLHVSSKGIRAGSRTEYRVALCIHVHHLLQHAAGGADNETTCLWHFNFNLSKKVKFCLHMKWYGMICWLRLIVKYICCTLQEALGPFLSCEAPLIEFRDSASYWYSYLCRVLYLWATRLDKRKNMHAISKNQSCKNEYWLDVNLLTQARSQQMATYAGKLDVLLLGQLFQKNQIIRSFSDIWYDKQLNINYNAAECLLFKTKCTKICPDTGMQHLIFKFIYAKE